MFVYFNKIIIIGFIFLFTLILSNETTKANDPAEIILGTWKPYVLDDGINAESTLTFSNSVGVPTAEIQYNDSRGFNDYFDIKKDERRSTPTVVKFDCELEIYIKTGRTITTLNSNGVPIGTQDEIDITSSPYTFYYYPEQDLIYFQEVWWTRAK